MIDLSIVIPARNEMFLNRTIESILEARQGATEVVVVLDGAWPVEPVPDHERVTLLYHPEPVGQRAACNDGARLARGWYVMKLDAHCAVAPGFDVDVLEAFAQAGDDATIVPLMYNLHAFDWVCPACGWRHYQGPTPEDGCPECGGAVERDVLWQPKPSPATTAMRLDRDLKFQYWSGYKTRQEGDLVETMSLLGACFTLTRKRWFDLDICDENHGGWGQQGTEVACKTWLSGGRLLCTKTTWFAHMFRTQGGDFGFPYPLRGSDVGRARDYSKALWRADAPDEMPRWDGAIHPLSWLVERFAPVPDWHGEETGDEAGASVPAEPEATPALEVAAPGDGPSKAILYYTDNRLDSKIAEMCRRQLLKADLPVVCASIKPVAGFAHNVVVPGKRGPLQMFRQILAGLEATDAEIIFFAEHDVLYHPSHFEFEPERDDVFYYNNNLWKVDVLDGHGALFHYSNHTSQLCARRDLLLAHYQERVRRVEAEGFSLRMGYEPGTHGRAERVDDHGCATWMSETPNVDLRHGGNLTRSRWEKSEFRNQRFTRGWTRADEVPGWGPASEILEAV